MKKIFSLIVSALLFFGLTGVAQDFEFSGSPAGSSLFSGGVYDEDTKTMTFSQAWGAGGWDFYELVEEERGENTVNVLGDPLVDLSLYNGVVIEIEPTTANIKVVLVYEVDGTVNFTEGRYDEATITGGAGLSTISIAFGEGKTYAAIGLQTNWCQAGCISVDPSITSEDLKVVSVRLAKVPTSPSTLGPKIDFRIPEWELGYEVPGGEGSSPANPVATLRGWGWAEGGDDVSIVEGPDGEKALRVDPVGGDGPYNMITVFNINLPGGKTFADVKQVKFDVYFPEGTETWESEELFQQLIVTVGKVENLAKDMKNFHTFALAYYDYEDDPTNFGPLAQWNTITFDIASFMDFDKNFRAVAQRDEDLPFDVDPYALPHVPSPAAVNGETAIQLGIGVQGLTYYMRSIELVIEGTGVESILSAPSFKVYSIQGGLFIDSEEKAAIYGIDGSLIATAKGQVTLSKGIYIVKVGGEAVKAIVK